MKAAHINRVVWFARTPLLVLPGLTTSQEAYAREMRRLKVEGPDHYVLSGAGATTHFFESPHGEHIGLVCIDIATKPRDIAEVAAMVAHECVHIWQQSLEVMRENAPGREVEAYNVQWLVLQMMAELYPLKDGRK